MCLKFGWCQIAKRRMNALARVDIVEKLPKALVGVVKIEILAQIDFLLFNRPHQPLSKAIFLRFANRRHADLDFVLLQQIGVIHTSILNPLVAVVDQWAATGCQRPL